MHDEDNNHGFSELDLTDAERRFSGSELEHQVKQMLEHAATLQMALTELSAEGVFKPDELQIVVAVAERLTTLCEQVRNSALTGYDNLPLYLELSELIALTMEALTTGDWCQIQNYFGEVDEQDQPLKG